MKQRYPALASLLSATLFAAAAISAPARALAAPQPAARQQDPAAPQAAAPGAAAAPAVDRATLEQQLQSRLDGARLVGQFSVVGADGAAARPPQVDQYAVSNLERDVEGRWVFNVSMSYGTQQHTMPVPVTIEWAGDTPMITMTEQTIPGLGTFTARVLLYEGLYAGTWKHGQFGGHMWGRIEPPGSSDAPAAQPGASSSASSGNASAPAAPPPPPATP